MAPTKSTTTVSTEHQTLAAVTANLIPLSRKGLSRKKSTNIGDQNLVVGAMQTRGKRKAENSPMKNEKIKRSALGNLTNNVKLMSLTSTASSIDDGVNHKQGFKQSKKANNKDNNHYGGMQVQVLKDAQNINANNYVNGSGNVQKKEQINNLALATKIVTRANSRNAGGHLGKVLDSETCKILATAATAVFNAQERQNQLVSKQLPGAPIVKQAVPPVAKTQQKPVRRISNEFNKTEESLYMSALDISTSESIRLSGNFEAAKRRSVLDQNQKTNETEETSNALENEVKNIQESDEVMKVLPELEQWKVPEGVEDFDKANWSDPFQVSCYAMDIFNYLKTREKDFHIHDYMGKQVHLSKWMRSLLVDWMVEVQETFELNHETLYLAVKIVDLYLCKVVIYKDKLQLLGAAALFIACKFDERTPPLIEDFLYICDGAYKQDELIHMEMQALKTIGFDLGIPLSYRFLRRYARCGKIPMPTLTLARYILELSLMEYEVISCSDSQLAAAALFIALRLHGVEKPWSPTLEYYSGYKLTDFAELVPLLNSGLHRKPKGTIKTIRSKYSHKIFHEVAKVPLMTIEKLFEKNLDLANTSLQLMQIDEQQNNQKPPPLSAHSNHNLNKATSNSST